MFSLTRVYIYIFFFSFLSTIKAFRRSLKKRLVSHKVEGKFVLSRVDPIAISFLSDLPHESQNFCRQFPISDELSNRT